MGNGGCIRLVTREEHIANYARAVMDVLPLCPSIGDVYVPCELYKTVLSKISSKRKAIELRLTYSGKTEKDRFRLADAIAIASFATIERDVDVSVMREVIQSYYRGELI